MKKFSIVILIIFIAMFLMILSSCNNNQIVEISVKEGSLKTVYQLDEELDLTNAILTVKTKKGKVSETPLLKAMFLNKFNSHITGENSAQIEYKSVKTTFTYSVEYEREIDSPFRIAFEKASSTKININSKNLDFIANGVFIINLEFELTGMEYISTNLMISSNYAISSNFSNGILKVLIYNVTGTSPLTADLQLLALNINKKGEVQSKISLLALKITNGERDFINFPMPSINV